MHLRALDVGSDRICQPGKFAHIRGRSNIKALREIVYAWVRRSEVRWETTVEGRIDELRHLRKDKLANMLECQTGAFHSRSDRHGLEVTTMMHCARLAINKGVIRRYFVESPDS